MSWPTVHELVVMQMSLLRTCVFVCVCVCVCVCQVTGKWVDQGNVLLTHNHLYTLIYTCYTPPSKTHSHTHTQAHTLPHTHAHTHTHTHTDTDFYSHCTLNSLSSPSQWTSCLLTLSQNSPTVPVRPNISSTPPTSTPRYLRHNLTINRRYSFVFTSNFFKADVSHHQV